MFLCRRMLLALPILMWLMPQASAQPTPEQPKVSGKNFNVRSTATVNADSLRTGVVDEIDEKGMTVLCDNVKDQVVVPVQLHPLEVHTQGKVVKNTRGHNAYRWQDLKKGDSVWVEAKYDHGEERWYAVTIQIRKRPGGKLPESQDQEHYPEFAVANLLNDLENGEDVSDEEIKKVCPPGKEVRDPRGKLLREATPGGLPDEYQKTLDAIRAKKAKEKDEPKAKPPEKEKK